MKSNSNQSGRILWLCLIFFLLISSVLSGQSGEKIKIRFIDYYFENGSPLSWEIQGDTIIKVSLLPDYERESLNRQTDHWNFRLEAEPGAHIKLILSKSLADVYNGKIATNWWNFKNDISCYISYDQKKWEVIRTSRLPGFELLVEFNMKAKSVYIARIPPYTISDLENLKSGINKNKLVKIYNIGTTVEKRPLEIIQLGNQSAPHSVVIRARAHPWEAGGNWVVEGLINKYLGKDSKKWSDKFCIYIMPMANKDGVARGMTRFNVSGKDLNRNWEVISDSVLCPEKYYFERFIAGLIKKGYKPDFAIDLHMDDYGSIGPAPHNKNDETFLKNIQLYEKLMRKYTSFSEEVSYSWKTDSQVKSFMYFNGGLLTRYGIEAITYEFNANWIRGLNKIPEKEDYIKVGENLNNVFYEYLDEIIR
jgi:hypothetical protein